VTNGVGSPRELAQPLGWIVEASRERASNLAEVTANTDDPELRRSIREYRDEITEEAERVSEAVADEDSERFGCSTSRYTSTHHVPFTEFTRYAIDTKATFRRYSAKRSMT
jgi:hypothetical protein